MHFCKALSTMDKMDLAVLMLILTVSLKTVGSKISPSEARRGSRGKRMINGAEADLHNWPFLVPLTYTDDAHVHWKICSATSVSKRWLVTVTHCVLNKSGNVVQPESLKIQLRSRQDPYKSEAFKAEKIVIRPAVLDANALPQDSEIALIKLEKNASSYMVPIKLHRGKEVPTNCRSAGWGSQEVLLRGREDILERNYSISSTLQEIDVSLNVSWKECLEASGIKHEYASEHDHSILCGGAKTSNSSSAQGGCIGDSGSPLVCESNEGVKLFGLLIGGDNRCVPGRTYMGFTDIAKHFRWLLSKIRY